MHAYIHGGWAHRQRVSTIFLTRKNSHNCYLFFIVLLMGFQTSGLRISSPVEPPHLCLHWSYRKAVFTKHPVYGCSMKVMTVVVVFDICTLLSEFCTGRSYSVAAFTSRIHLFQEHALQQIRLQWFFDIFSVCCKGRCTVSGVSANQKKN